MATMTENTGIVFGQSNAVVSMECAATDTFGDFYPGDGHDEEARRQAYAWLQKTLTTIAAMCKAAEQPLPASRGRRRRAKG